MEVWQTSNLRPLRLGEEKKKKERKKLQGKNIMAPLLHRAAINSMKIYMVSLLYRATINKPQHENIMVCPIT